LIATGSPIDGLSGTIGEMGPYFLCVSVTSSYTLQFATPLRRQRGEIVRRKCSGSRAKAEANDNEDIIVLKGLFSPMRAARMADDVEVDIGAIVPLQKGTETVGHGLFA